MPPEASETLEPTQPPASSPGGTSTLPPYTRRGTCRRGFTLIEMLVVVSIIVFLMAITFPVIGTLQRGGRVETGLNTVSLAGSVARTWSTASLPQVDQILDPPNTEPGHYSGTAAIFCPTGEVRIVINYQLATRNGSSPTSPSFSNSLEFNHQNGYRDYRIANGGRRDVDYIAIPQGTGIAGIHRFGQGAADVELLAPPFAIAFDETGALMQGHRDPSTSGRNPANFVYYDANLDGRYNTTNVRTTSYDPADWDRDSDNARGIGDAFLNANLVRQLPFDAIETVAGVIIYDKTEYKAAGFSFAGGGFVTDVDTDTLPDDAYDWLRENGTVVFFSPNTGVALRDEGSE